MIALNKSMPKTCFECPCLQTYVIEDEYHPNIQHLLRHCAAKGMTMVTIPWKTNTSVSKEWTDWPIPEWCPWIEIGDKMKILSNKEYEKRMKWVQEGVELKYKQKALILDLIGNMFGRDFSTMPINEIEEFFHWCDADIRMYQFGEGMKAGTDSIIDTFEKCGLARKHTLEKLRFRVNKAIHNKMEEYKEKINE